jgi:protein-L-isoaspartate(D-aspartate) O-methyltransferase
MEDRSQKSRSEFASLVAARTRGRNPAIERAFASVRREAFAGPGPWSIAKLDAAGYVRTPNDDPAHLYQDVVIALDPVRNLNIGLPSGHAIWLDAIDVKAGDHVVQVGAGTGYYTAILAHLVGGAGRVDAFEIEPDFADRAAENLRHLPHVKLHPRSGLAGDLPNADLIYVCVGTTQPYQAWLDAMRPGARLLFPMQPDQGAGGMLLIQRPDDQTRDWPARFLSRSRFTCCEGPRDAVAGSRLAEAFSSGWREVRSFRVGSASDDTSWFAGDGWWLSTEAIDAGGSI